MKLKQIGHYKILDKLGEGGMGVVYKAEDTKLKRTVALKFLPLDRLGTKEEKDRFVREAQAAAALNHPNIATIYSIDEEEGHLFISMEYIQGESLKEKTASAPLKLKKVLDISAQTALGLQAAHEQGVVHRDIKSSNIMVTPKGQVKIMDFGLAKFSGSTLLTKAGTTLGTIAYMSPEQAQGEEVDLRTDIWAFGVVLYEMVTGQIPFQGDYDQAMIYSILNEEPEPLSALRSRVPLELERIVEKCLAKDAASRYQNANELPVDLKAIDISSGGSTSKITATRSMSTLSTMATPGPKKPSRFKRALKWTFAALVLLAAGFSVWRFWVSPLRELVHRLVINTDENLVFWQNSAVTISPDGKNIVYVSQQNGEPKLFLRSLEKFESTPIQGTENGNSPFFSPDGQWIGFYADGKLKKASIFGGVPTKLLELEAFLGASWTQEDTIYFSTRSNGNWFLAKISATGGTLQPVTLTQNPLEPMKVCWPQVLPGGETILFTSIAEASSNPDEGQIEVLSLATGERRKVLEGGTYARYSPTGHIVAAWSGGLLGVPFDLSKLEVTGPTIPVLEGILLGSSYIPNYTFSEDGLLVFVQGAKGGVERRIMAANLQGGSQLLLAKHEEFSQPQFSPDENQIALTIEKNGNSNIWLSSLNDDGLRQLTFDGNNSHPVWTPDGNSLTYVSDRDGSWNLFRQSLEGAAQAEQLTTGDNPKWPASWSPNGSVLAYHEEHPDSSLDIWLLKMNDRKPEPFLQTRFNERQPTFSPNGLWIAFVSDQSGQDEVYVRAFADKNESTNVSSAGGKWPMWHLNSQQLYYRFRDQLMAVAITTNPKFSAAPARELFVMHTRGGQMNISPKSARFLFVEADLAQEVSQLNVVLNWFEELNSKVPSGKRFFGIKF